MGGKECLHYKWVYLFHMGLFFACSGYLYKWKEDAKLKVFAYDILKKIVRILIPFLVWGIIMFLYDNRKFNFKDVFQYIIVYPHYGLWFLQSLAKCFIIISLVNFASGFFYRYTIQSKFVTLCFFAFISVICHCYSILGFLFDWNLCLFIFGLLMRQYEYLFKIINNRILSSLAFICFILPLHTNTFMCKELVSIAAIIVFINFGLNNSLPGKIRKQIEYFGCNSMPIYLLHFFFVSNLFHYNFISNQLFLFAFLLLISVVIAYFCLFIYRSFSFGLIPLLLWGELYEIHNSKKYLFK